MPRVKHMAIMSRDPEAMKEYYSRWFGFEELCRTPGGSIYLTDGHLNIGLLKQGADSTEERQELGLHHVGFHVESMAEIEGRLKKFDPTIRLEKRGGSEDPYSEYRVKEAVQGGFGIEVSEKGFGIEGEKRIPGIRHIAGSDVSLERRLRFYTEIFGMQQVEKREDGTKVRVCVGDGFVNICLVSRVREGANHFGILIRDPVGVTAKMAEAYPSRPELWQVTRPGVEAHILDFERNNLSLSASRGWEIAPGNWDKIN